MIYTINTMLVPMNAKKQGRKPYFSPEIQQAIYECYFVKGMDAKEVQAIFAPLAPDRKVSQSAIRWIAAKVRAQLAAKGVEDSHGKL